MPYSSEACRRFISSCCCKRTRHPSFTTRTPHSSSLSPLPSRSAPAWLKCFVHKAYCNRCQSSAGDQSSPTHDPVM